MYASVGLGALTKGPVAIALPALAFGLYLLVRGELRRVTSMMIPLGIVIVGVIVVPWYFALYREQGWTYISSFLINENVERFTQGVGVRQPRAIWFYIPVVLSDSFPLSVLVFAAAAAWKERTQIETLLWCWIGSIVVFFSFSAGKQDLYIFPIVPAVAALAGIAIQRGLERPEWRKWVTGTVAVTGGLLTIAGAAVVSLFNTAGRVYALDSALIVGVLALTGGIAALALSVARRTAGAALTLLAAIVALNWTFVIRVLPEFERYKPVPAFSETLRARLQPGDVVVHYKVSLPSMVFYLRRPIVQKFDEAEFLAAMRSSQRVYAVMTAGDYKAIQPRLEATCVIDRRPTFEVKLREVLNRQPLPEILLIANRCP
jgi:4-amino-4-deoxy-L-arabinose transferase-like glycosyltransferase